MVHAGYMGWRAPLLRQGVALYELRPGRAGTERELLGSSGASLHTKAFVVDGARGFVGSFNFDPRSAQLNTEMGVVFDQPALAAEVRRLFDAGTRPESAWRVELAADGSLRWQAGGERVDARARNQRRPACAGVAAELAADRVAAVMDSFIDSCPGILHAGWRPIGYRNGGVPRRHARMPACIDGPPQP
jgi:phosphatidylserine/phosphatidylglycerophosphate/cardiolipin synthase-like enzyme